MAFNVAIIGAGPAGCMLARLLSQSHVDIKTTIFENESSLNFRSQGGTLDLRSGSGLDAMKAAGLWSEFVKHARYDGEALKLADKNLLCYIKMGASSKEKSGGHPEIDRPVLRRLLFESLPEGCVKWSHKLTKVDEDLTLHFANQPSQSGFDLIVGADGAWSKVRPRISDDVPFYSGVAGHQMVIPDAQQRHKKLYDIVNRGSVFSVSDGKSIMAQNMGDGSLNIATWSVRPENWQKQAEYDPHDVNKVREACRKEYADWNPDLVAFTQEAEEVVPRDLYMLPIGNNWQHIPGVTLIGDAAHLATPFAGMGVNLALQDSLLLSKAIISAASTATKPKVSLDGKVKAFEEDMFKRAKTMQELTFEGLKFLLHNPQAPRAGIEKWVVAQLKDELGLFTWIAAPFVYAWFFVFKLIW